MRTLYFTILSILLLCDLVYNIWYIRKYRTLGFARKTILTAISGTLLAGVSIALFKWYGLLLWPFSVILWATIKDAVIGVWFHRNPFYLSETTQPDKWLLKYFGNGTLYLFFKIVCLIFFSGLLRYIQ